MAAAVQAPIDVSAALLPIRRRKEVASEPVAPVAPPPPSSSEPAPFVGLLPIRRRGAVASAPAIPVEPTKPAPTEERAAALGGLLPIRSRQVAASPAPVPSAPAPPAAPAPALGALPIRSRSAVAGAPAPSAVPPTAGPSKARPNYVVETVTTPVQKDRLPRWAQHSFQSSPPQNSLSTCNSSLLELNSNYSFSFAPGAFARATHCELTEKYSIDHHVGEGKSGAVVIVRHKETQKQYACKILRKAEHQADILNREIQTLRQFDHPNVVRLFEVAEDDEHVFLLMELCHGGDLFARIDEDGHLDETLARDLAQQMLSALAYCHARGVAHRDIKPENFLLEHDSDSDGRDPTLKLADFGIATSIRPAHVASMASGSLDGAGAWPSCRDVDLPGSLPYMAPEVLESNGAVRNPAAADLWSCGVVLYGMLSGEQLFRNERDILSGRVPGFHGPIWQNVSENAKDLILKLLNRNPAERLTAEQALAHPWFHDVPCEVTIMESFTPASFASFSREFAESFLLRMRAWREKPKLQRVAIAAIARRVEEQHEAQKAARTAFSLASDAEQMTCARLVEWLHTALSTDLDAETCCQYSRTQTPARFAYTPSSMTVPGTVPGTPSVPTPETNSCASTDGSATRFHTASTRSGLHLRRRMKLLAKSMSTSKSEEASVHEKTSFSVDGLVNLTEIRHLVGALDMRKNGYVEYSLLVASMLQPEVLCEETRVREAFELFDLEGRGLVAAKDVQRVLLHGDHRHGAKGPAAGCLRQLSEMMTPFDTDGDGCLNFKEFASMVRSGS